jgi:ankyrin repeat protein
MSDRNLYNPGTSQRNPLHGTVAEQDAYIREELSQAMVGDTDVLTREEEEAEDGRSNDFDNSHYSVGDDELDPAHLYSKLEAAIPKQTEAGRVLTVAEQQQKREMIEHVWDTVRHWLRRHPLPEERQAAAFVRGQADATPLHLMCKLHNPPIDVIQEFVLSAPEVVSWTDNHGWLPLHHACANGASTEVLKLLCEQHPTGKLHQDNQNRTPLHFYATRNSDHPATMAINAELLADTGAAELADRGGMLPMHYACAYGTDPAVLAVLSDAYPESLEAKENKWRTPMHLAMVNAHRDASPNVIRFLLDNPISKATVNSRDQDGYLPLHLLALGLRGYRADDSLKRSNVSECLSMYLNAEPVAAADFLTAIQDLPDWLQDTAVVSKHVRNVLNEKIIQRFPTSILMLDGYFLIVIIICFELTTRNHINIQLGEGYENDTQGALVILFVGAAYFLMREFVQILSLMSLGSLSSWWVDPANWLDISVIVLVTYYGSLMVSEDFRGVTFRSGVAFTKGILWLAVINFLKSTLVDFAVFVAGVFYVVQRLAAFLTAVGVILLAFAQMFYFIYVETEICDKNVGNPENFCRFPHCTFEESLLKVYTMVGSASQSFGKSKSPAVT